MSEFVEFLKQVLSEEGTPSCKRVCAMLCTLSAIFYTGVAVFKSSEGSSDLVATLLIVALALLGIYNITSIFKTK